MRIATRKGAVAKAIVRDNLAACMVFLLLAGLAACLLGLSPDRMNALAPWAMAPLIVASGWTLFSLYRRRLRRETLADRMEAVLLVGGAAVPDPAPSADRLAAHAERMIVRLESIEHRFAQAHGVTGLPTREPLIVAIAESGGNGLLGIVELCDFDRLCIFDLKVADHVLQEVAARMIRMVGGDRFVAHVDRARFAVWCPGTPPGQARTELDAICYALRDRIVLPGIDMLPQIRSASIWQSGDPLDAAALVARAIASLAGAETGTPLFHGEGSVASARQIFAFEQDLRQATAHNQLELWFQPFVDAAAQAVCGAEALLRWRHPDHGLISPTAFVPVMEAAGLAEEIGLWTLNAGCRQAKAWQRDGLAHLKLAINLSAHQLERGDVDVLVDRTLRRHGLPPALLELELTETAAAVDAAGARLLFDKLRALGVAISIDDFGAGYSSLSYLKKLRFDKLKIDREFVTDVDGQRDSQAICQSIIALARGLGIEVLAEGVERAEEYAWLRRHGCSLFQGYYFSRPLQAVAFPAFVHDRDRIRRLTDLSIIAADERLAVGA